LRHSASSFGELEQKTLILIVFMNDVQIFCPVGPAMGLFKFTIVRINKLGPEGHSSKRLLFTTIKPWSQF